MSRIGQRVVAVGLGLVGALVFMEIAVRIVLPPPERARVADTSRHEERLAHENAEGKQVRLLGAVDDESGGGVLYFHTPTGMRFRANTRAVIENHRLGGLTVEIETNSLGHRNRELGPKDRTRVLFLGDSITAQDYLPEQTTIVRQVERLSESTEDPLETINAGVGAIGLATELAILQETGFAAEPDIVVLNWYLNDVEVSAGVQILEPTGWLSNSRLAELLLSSIAGLEPNRIRHDMASLATETARAWRAQVERDFPGEQGDFSVDPGAFNYHMRQLMFDWGSAWADGAWERMTPLLEEMKRQTDAYGAKLLIVAFPVNEQVLTQEPQDFPQRRLAEVAARIDAPFLDLLPVLRAAHRETDEKLFWDWCHPSPFGSRLIAEAILEFVQAHG